MAEHLSDDEIAALARIASASNNYSGGRWISAEFSRNDLLSFARSVIAANEYEAALASPPVAVQEEGDAKDAARYRWLREQCKKHDGLVIAETASFGLLSWSGDDPDRAIDAAMAAMKGDQP